MRSRAPAARRSAFPATSPIRRRPPRVLDQARQRFATIDVLVNNAGKATPTEFLDNTDELWLDGLQLNFLSAVRFTRACLPEMVEQQWGRIINISSSTSKNADPLHAVYGAAKAALNNFSRTVATRFAADGIRCSAVLPGIIMTPLIEGNVRAAAEARGITTEQVVAGAMKRWPFRPVVSERPRRSLRWSCSLPPPGPTGLQERCSPSMAARSRSRSDARQQPRRSTRSAL